MQSKKKKKNFNCVLIGNKIADKITDKITSLGKSKNKQKEKEKKENETNEEEEIYIQTEKRQQIIDNFRLF